MGNNIKIGHFSDCHLGYVSGRKRENGINIREQDGYNAFNKAIDEMIENKIDICLLTGDIFHSPKPSTNTIVEAQKGLRRLADANIPVYILAGNHDATDVTYEIPSSHVVHEPNSKIYSYYEPYVVKEVAKGLYIHFVSHHGFLEQQETMKVVKPIPNAFNILASHGSVFDEYFNIILKTAQSPREVIIPEEIMNMNWDYILLGHIHTRGWVGSKDGLTDTAKKKTYYAGSLIRRGFSDEECKLGRGWTLWDIDLKKSTMKPTMFTIPERPQFDYTIYAENKSAIEIEEEILTIFKGVSYDIMPIMRITIVGITNGQRLAIAWKNFAQYTEQCLTFNFKLIKKEEVKAQISKETFAYNIVDAYNEYWKQVENNIEEDIRENVKEKSTDFLKQGQSITLEK